MNFGEIWKSSNPIAKVLFILILLYAGFSLYILLWRLGVTGNILTIAEENILLAVYCFVSFAFSTIVASFHLSTLILRRKRAADNLENTARSTPR